MPHVYCLFVVNKYEEKKKNVFDTEDLAGKTQF